MRATDILGLPVVDRYGIELGPLRDLRIDGDLDAGPLRVRWLVVGGHETAHRFGYVDGRTRGPWLLKWLLRHGGEDTALAVPAASVKSWGPDRIVLEGRRDDAAVAVEQAAQSW